MTVPLIRFAGVGKRFQAVVALSEVSFEVQTGEFHALCGENGAGKSTLMKILSGVITDYEGTIELNGAPLKLRGTRDAEQHGISIIHQELNLVSELSVAANVFLGRELRNAWGLLATSEMERRTRELMDQLECTVDPRESVNRLRIGDQQLVEIAKALSLQSRLLIMDEPTSALTEIEVARLFRVIARLRSQGVTIIYISHKMDEVFGNADALTVLRDGRVIRSMLRSETSPQQVTSLMVGRELEATHFHETRQPGAVRLNVQNLSLPWRNHPRQWRLKDVSLTVRGGEVVGVAGLMGAGRTELLECLYGAASEPPQGTILLNGKPVNFLHPAEALDAGVSLVSEDRKRLGIFAQMSVREHISLSALDRCAVAGLVSRRREAELVQQSIGAFAIKTAGPTAPITSLSGGNQQKCLIARALAVKPELLLLDDPTRGIDVGAKAEIYRLIHELCCNGLAILITSSELPELLTVCDRIIVLCEGRVTGEFQRHEFSEAALMDAATGRVVKTA